jgi:hypothetical protein
VYDSSPEDIKSVRYEFLKGGAVIKTFDVAVGGAISEMARRGELIRGKSFKIRQRFSVPKDKGNPSIRVTVTGGNSSAGPVSASASTTALRLDETRPATTVELKPIRLSFPRRGGPGHKRAP